MDRGVDLLVAGVVAVVSCVLTVAACHLRARRRPLPVVRAALGDPDPTCRQAAVLIAARHGLSRYVGVLLDLVDTETSDTVRTALAEALVDGEWKNADTDERSVRLRSWGARLLSEPPSRSRRSPVVRPSCGLTGRAVRRSRYADRIDALEVMDGLAPGQASARTPARRSTGVSRRRKGIAGLHEIDALEVVYAVNLPPEQPRAVLVSTLSVTRTSSLLALPAGAAVPPDELDALIQSLLDESRRPAALPPAGSIPTLAAGTAF